MAMYEYECADCGAKFTEIRKVEERDAPIQCNTCGSENTTRVVVQPTNFELKGSGWAKDRYGK